MLAGAGVDEAPAGTDPASSSLSALVENVASALEARAILEGVSGPTELVIEAGRGVDRRKVDRGFSPRLRKRLKDKGILLPAGSASLQLRLSLSEERGQVWVVGVFEGASLVGPSTVARSHAVDRELEVAIGASVKPQQTRFVLERLGLVPSGVLDVLLVDVDGDTADEIALLTVDGLVFMRLSAGNSGARLERVGALAKLPSDRRWPRIVTGWLALLDPSTLWMVTSAGHSMVFDIKTQKLTPGLDGLVPLKGTTGPQGPLCAAFRPGSPVLGLPLVTMQRRMWRAAPMPSRVRDLVQLSNVKDGALLVDEAGTLMMQVGAGEPLAIAPERVGDRVVAADLDADGAMDVLTTSASSPGDADHVVLRRLHAEQLATSVLFRTPLSGGSIVALAIGQLDYDGRADAVLVEEAGGETVLWRLRHAP
jgi:hypothetical protein